MWKGQRKIHVLDPTKTQPDKTKKSRPTLRKRELAVTACRNKKLSKKEILGLTSSKGITRFFIYKKKRKMRGHARNVVRQYPPEREEKWFSVGRRDSRLKNCR